MASTAANLTGRGRRRRPGRLVPAIGGSALGVTYLSIVVLIPIAALVAKAFDGGGSAFWAAVTEPESRSALVLNTAP